MYLSSSSTLKRPKPKKIILDHEVFEKAVFRFFGMKPSQKIYGISSCEKTLLRNVKRKETICNKSNAEFLKRASIFGIHNIKSLPSLE